MGSVMVMVFSSMLLIPSRGQPSTLLEKDVSEYLRRIIEDYLCDKFLIYVGRECNLSSFQLQRSARFGPQLGWTL